MSSASVPTMNKTINGLKLRKTLAQLCQEVLPGTFWRNVFLIANSQKPPKATRVAYLHQVRPIIALLWDIFIEFWKNLNIQTYHAPQGWHHPSFKTHQHQKHSTRNARNANVKGKKVAEIEWPLTHFLTRGFKKNKNTKTRKRDELTANTNSPPQLP